MGEKEKATPTLADELRGDFEILERLIGEGPNRKPLIYFDSAATSQKPQSVVKTIDDYYRRYNSNVHRGAHTLAREATEAYEAARDQIAQFVHANHREEIVFTKGATEALNLIAQTYGRTHLRGPTDEVLLTVVEHHANLVPWHILQSELGFTIRYVRLDPVSGSLDLNHFESLLNENTKIVSFQHISNVLGMINPVSSMVQMVRQRAAPTAKVILDACQSMPHLQVNVRELGIDFLVASGHKMFGPTGIGFLWGKLEVLNSMPPFLGGGEMIDRVTLAGSTWLSSPSRFEAGTPPIAPAIGLGAAVQYLQHVGMDRIEAYEHELAQYLYQQLSQVPGIRILGPPSGVRRAALCAFVHEKIHASDLGHFLDTNGVAVRAGHHCCQPLHNEVLGIRHSIRASLSFYNTKDEIDLFIRYLKETIAFFESFVSEGNLDVESEGDGAFIPFV